MHPAAVLLPLLQLSSVPRLAIAVADTNATTGGNTSCAPATCGSLSIAYPFSLAGVQPLYCGFPAFQLTCDAEAGRAFLTRTFRERLYRVLDIFYDNSSLVVAVETTFAGDERCNIPDFNVSSGLSLFPLNISRADKNLTFIYNCEVPQGLRLPNPCANHSIGAYMSGDEQPEPEMRPKNNCSFVTVPVHEADPGMGPARNRYAELLKKGFLAEWVELGDCGACRGRGGECRFVEIGFQCCPRGSLCSHTSTAPCDRRKKADIKLIVALSALASIVVLTFLACIMYCQKKKRISFDQKNTAKEKNIEEILNGYDSLVPKRYKYSELKKITRSFKDKLGEGGYGTVFKGNLQDGREVAVKLLKGSKGNNNGEEFLNEVVSFRRTSHINIVNLLGFCLHGSKRALIYEYMANGSLEKYIYSEESKRATGWEKLREIAIGIARGLEYLHRGCNTRIIHFDIKPHNMLLDEDFCPKSADFGLAKLCHLKDSALSMAEARGTIGFIAPEVFSRGFGVVSTKSDVYSYGMMLLEMVGRRKNVKEHTENSSEAYFPNWVYDRLVEDLQSHEVTSETEDIARQMTLVGLWCIQTAPGNRPSMSRVIEMLEKNITELEMPPKPFLSFPSEPTNFSS